MSSYFIRWLPEIPPSPLSFTCLFFNCFKNILCLLDCYLKISWGAFKNERKRKRKTNALASTRKVKASLWAWSPDPVLGPLILILRCPWVAVVFVWCTTWPGLPVCAVAVCGLSWTLLQAPFSVPLVRREPNRFLYFLNLDFNKQQHCAYSVFFWGGRPY